MESTEIVMGGPFEQLEGFCWRFQPDPALFPETDDFSDPAASTLIFSEDGRDVGQAHTAIDMVRQHGGGLFSHWMGNLYFSTTDNSDPHTNGRRYTIRRDPRKYFDNMARYALGIVETYAAELPEGIEAFRNKKVLEIGPGRTMGTVLAIAALGGRVLAVDRFCGDWQAGWHEPFLASLRSALTAKGWPVDLTGFDAVIERRDFASDRVTVETRPMELIGSLYPGYADISLSHSTFEHFYSVDEAAGAIFAASASGSVGVHNVDFRDHRNFGTPLEFLLVGDQAYVSDDALNDLFGRGNRVRSGQMTRAFRRAGFSSVEFRILETVDSAYLSDFLPRLREAEDTGFRTIDAADLEVLAGRFILRKSG
jgi:hypothetical protein